ncbi:MAG TPA: DUF4249 domain-containing protein [Puia sp.]
MKLFINYKFYFFAFFFISCCWECRKAYVPSEITTNYNYLVVDGFINMSPGGITTITLSRTRLIDSVANVVEPGAQVSVQGDQGDVYSLGEIGNGVYSSSALTLDLSHKYKLTITTSDSHRYESDLVMPKQTPKVDSMSWRLTTDPNTDTAILNVFVNTHDPANNTHYYRWDYIETWEYDSYFETSYAVANNMIYTTNPTNDNHRCWETGHSNNILLGTSVALAQDVISMAPIATFQKNDYKMDIRYSMNVNQYALTPEAYNYWQLIQKNSQQLGSLYDVQPSQLPGNIHSLTNPAEPVIGFVSACSLQQQRIFIDHSQAPGWRSQPIYSCPLRQLPADPTNFGPYNYADTTYAPYYFTGGGYILVISKKDCLDCRRHGGSPVKPSFW